MSPAKAIRDLFINPREYAISCLAATYLVMRAGGGANLASDYNVDRGDWIPGDWGFIQNTNHNPGEVGYEGENIIYLGNDQYWGLITEGSRVGTLGSWEMFIQTWGAAKLQPTRKWPTVGMFRWSPAPPW